MTSVPPTPTSAPATTSASLSMDAFDAIVQAANPSHPNHAAWVEKFGGSTPRRTVAKDSDSNSHLERSESPGRRRRRVSSHNGSRAALPQFPPDLPEYAGSGKVRSRAQSSVVDPPAQNSRLKGEQYEASQHERRPSEELARRRRRKKRDKEKERSGIPPIPPPRTTSHAPPSPPIMMPPPASPASYQTTSTSSRGHPTFAESSRPPRSPLRASSNHSRAISTQLPSISTLPGTHEANSSPVRGRFNAEPPSRMSSRIPTAIEADAEHIMTRTADSPTQTISSHSVSVSRKGSLRSVDFALPEEPPRRGSLDSYNIRKSFDVLVSPFRNASKTNNRKVFALNKKNPGQAAAPILKSSIPEISQRYAAPNPTTYIPPSSRPLSRVADESEGGNVQTRPTGEATLKTTTVPIHPLATTMPLEIAEKGALTEEGEDFQDAKSDEGDNGSSAEERGHRSNGTASTIKRRAKKRNVDLHSATRARTKSVVIPGSVVNGVGEALRVSKTGEKLDSSASEGEHQNTAQQSAKSMPGPDTIKISAGDRMVDEMPSPRQQTVFPLLGAYNGAGIEAAGNVVEQSSYMPAMPTPDRDWRERFDQFALQTPSNPSTGHNYKDEAASSPLSSELLTTSESANVSKGARQEELPQKSMGRTGGRAFAGVMARMRRDRTTSANPLKGSAKNGEVDYLEGNTADAPFGLGIATPASEGTDTPQQKRWRTRLTSFSGKTVKSPKVEEEWKTDYMDAPLPPMPPKAMKMLGARKFSVPMEVDRDRNRQAYEEAINQGAGSKKGSQTAPLVSQEFGKKSGDFTREDSLATIHKTLSPALLTNRGHEADEVLSFIGSEGDGEDKRATWHSLNKLEMEPIETVEQFPPGTPITLQVTRPSMDARSVREEAQHRDKDMPMTPPVRRSSFSKSRLAGRASDGGLRKGGSPSSQMVSPPPLPTSPFRNLSRSPSEDDGKQQSPAPRASLDYRMPSWSRGFSRPSVTQLGSASRGPSFNLDRMPVEHQAASSLTLKETLGSPPKLGKRFFSSGSKGKTTSRGISSNDYSSPYQLGASRSELSVNGLGGGGGGRSGEEYNNERLENTNNGFTRLKESTSRDNSAVSPSSNNLYNALPPTPTVQQHFTTEEETAAFDKMLRESAKEDAARVKQIAIRTAQAHALRS